MLKSAKTYILMAFVSAVTFVFTSCDVVFDDEGDCSVTYRIKFRYDRNLKWADAFASEVKSVHLYIFDSEGVFVKEFTDGGDALAQPGYYMTLDLPAGDYQLVAWCGLENEGAEEESFTVLQPEVGVTTIEELTCSLNTKSDELYANYSDQCLYFLYHGRMEVTLPDTHDGSVYEYTMSLTKDTNHIRIILQELSGDDLNEGDYDISIEDANGLMAYDNELLGNTRVTYLPWKQWSDEVGVDGSEVDRRSLTYVRGVVADMTVGRLMETHKENLMLTIRQHEAPFAVIARVPVIQYALLGRKYYEETYGHAMDGQEFLDRGDEYVLTFFLYKNRWLETRIDILEWRYVQHEYEAS